MALPCVQHVRFFFGHWGPSGTVAVFVYLFSSHVFGRKSWSAGAQLNCVFQLEVVYTLSDDYCISRFWYSLLSSSSSVSSYSVRCWMFYFSCGSFRISQIACVLANSNVCSSCSKIPQDTKLDDPHYPQWNTNVAMEHYITLPFCSSRCIFKCFLIPLSCQFLITVVAGFMVS